MRSFRANKVENRFHEKQHFLSCEFKKALERNFKKTVQPLSKDLITHEFPSYERLLRFAFLPRFVIQVTSDTVKLHIKGQFLLLFLAVGYR